MRGPCEFWYGAARSANACWSVTGIRYFTLPIRPVTEGPGIPGRCPSRTRGPWCQRISNLDPRGWKGVSFKRC